MTTATVDDKEKKSPGHFDPDSFRMTIGEHLEELRWRLILGLIGLAVAIFGVFAFIQKVIVFFCAPLFSQLLSHHINTQMYYREITEVFMVYLKIWLISAAAIAGPWMLYQIWQFVAAGLYPKERKIVTKYIPLSIALLLSGFVFVYLVVLPLTIRFFIEFSAEFPLPSNIPVGHKIDAGKYTPAVFPVLDGDPAHPQDGEVWINQTEQRLKAFVSGEIRSIPFGSDNLLQPILTISEYIDWVLTFMIIFGVSFQLPLVVLALVSIGVVDVPFLKKQRKVVYFVMAVAAAFLAPGEIVTSMLSLLIPLVILYEFGLWLAQFNAMRAHADESDSSKP